MLQHSGSSGGGSFQRNTSSGNNSSNNRNGNSSVDSRGEYSPPILPTTGSSSGEIDAVFSGQNISDGEIKSSQTRLQQCWSICKPQRWKYPTITEARLISIIAIIVISLISFLGLIIATVGESSATLAFALDGIVDILGSIVILWRFQGGPGEEYRMQLREDRATVLIGFLFLISAVSVSTTAIIHLAKSQPPNDTNALLGLSIPSSFVLLLIGVVEVHVANVVKSTALYADGITSLVGSLQAALVVVGIFIYRSNEDLWWVDALFALVVVVGVVTYGLILLRKHPWCSKDFWFRSASPAGSSSSAMQDSGYDYGIDLKPIDMDTI